MFYIDSGKGILLRRSGPGLRNTLIALILMLTITAPILVSGQAAVASSTPVRGGTLTLTGNSLLSSLDPAGPSAEFAPSGQTIYAAIYDSLFYWGPKGVPEPGLALSYSISRDHEEVVLNLRHGVKFQDGTAFNATAVAWNLLRDARPSTGCTCATFMSDITGVTAPSPYKVVVYLSQPYAPIITLLESSAAAYMLSPAAFESEGATKFDQFPVGAGPFEVTSNNILVTLTLARFTGYWDKGHPYLNSIVYDQINSTATQYADMQTGASQMMQSPDTPSLNQAKSDSALKIVTLPTTQTTVVALNTTIPPFNNPTAREAFYDAIDPTPIISALYAGYAHPQEQLISPGMLFYPGAKLPGETFTSYNPSEAKALVQQLGGLTFSLLTYTPSALLLNEALQQQFNAVGMTVTIDSVALSAAIASIENKSFLAVSGNFGGYLSPGINTANYYGATALLNHGVIDSHLQGLLNQAESTFVPSREQTLYDDLMNYMQKERYSYPLFEEPLYLIDSSNLEGVPALPVTYLQNAWFK
jgi:peptide/nickel transport system substrate-binding protein